MRCVVTVRRAGRDDCDMLLDLDDAATVSDLLSVVTHGDGSGSASGDDAFAVGNDYEGGSQRLALSIGGGILAPERKLVDTAFAPGVVIVVAPPEDPLHSEQRGTRKRAPLRLEVVSGKGAGRSFDLPMGRTGVGASNHNSARISWLPPEAFYLDASMSGAVMLVPGSAEATLGEQPLVTPTPWQPGQPLYAFGSVFALRHTGSHVLATSRSSDGVGFDVSRPPRLLPREVENKFSLPSEPTRPKKRGFPWLMLLAPLVMAAVMVSVSGRMHYALFALMSPIMVLGSWISSRSGSKQDFVRDTEQYRSRIAAIEADVAEAVRAEQQERAASAPNPAQVLDIATTPGQRLWERRSDDPDFLHLRVGVGTIESQIKVTDPAAESHKRDTKPRLPFAPVTVDLKERGVIGVCGHPASARALVTWLAAQVATLHSPDDANLYVLATAERAAGWQWASWLPHTSPNFGQQTIATVGTDSRSVAARIGELAAVVEERQGTAKDSRADDARWPAIVVVVDGVRAMRRNRALAGVLEDGPEVGVYAICVDVHERYLPGEAGAIITLRDNGYLDVEQDRTHSIHGALADLPDDDWAEPLGRALAPLVDAGDVAGGAVPTSVRLVDLLPTPEIVAEQFAAWWTENGRSNSSPIGAFGDGPAVVDVVKDGPHALVAGTTGAGKSELLQSWIAGLAALNRPEDMCFVLVDYKGGAAFAECAELPHTVGLVTDLDDHLVQRALTSLRAELTYREELLNTVRAKNIDEYQHFRDKDPTLEPLPRLLLIIDEFAALAAELPDFVSGLIDFAQRGRSLGMHLVLATQRPAGVVTAPIRANTNLRICLRVTSAAESRDVIDAPEAALISPSTPGRGVMRSGPSAVHTFQGARVSTPASREVAVTEPWAAVLDPHAKAGPAPMRPKKKQEQTGPTDLSVMVRELHAATELVGSAMPRTPWLDPLPEVLVTAPTDDAPMPWARIDEPERQSQRDMVLDLGATGNIFFVGSGRSGRTTVLRTIAASIANNYSSAQAHIYALDCGNGGLAALSHLPHTGAVVPRTGDELIRKLLARLNHLVAQRGSLLAGAGVGGLDEYNRKMAATGGEQLSHIVVFIDRWEGWVGSYQDVDGGALHSVLTNCLAEGPSIGMHFLISGDRSLSSARLLAHAEERYALRFNEEADYTYFGLSHRDVPDNQPGGRLIDPDTGHHAQAFVLAAPDLVGTDRSHTHLSDAETAEATVQGAALEALGAHLTTRDAHVPDADRPIRIRALPTSITWDELHQASGSAGHGRHIALGVGGEAVEKLGPNLDDEALFTIAGPGKSGRSTLLMSVAKQLLAANESLVVVAPRVSPLRDLEGAPGVTAVFTDAQVKGEHVAEAMAARPRSILLVDDAELLKMAPCADWLAKFLQTAGDNGNAAVFAGTTADLSSGLSGWPALLRRARGAALTAITDMMDGEVLGARVSRSMIEDRPTPGRAVLNSGDGALTRIVCPKDIP